MLFDSGLGGLTVLAELRAILPDAPVIYAADLAGLPYGEKSEAEVAARVAGLLGRLAERYHPRLACIACNTASTIALGMVRDVLHLPIVGTVPAIKPAAAITKTGVVGLLGTAATIRQKYVDDLEAEFANGTTMIRHAAPELVRAAEEKLRGHAPDPALFTALAERMRGYERGAEIDTLVLACTHFPLLETELAEAFGPEVQLVHGAKGIARRIAHLVDGQAMRRTGDGIFVSTGPADPALAPAVAQYGLNRMENL